MTLAVTDILGDLSAATTPQGVADGLIDFAREQGFSRAHAWFGADMEVLEAGNYPDWWADYYFENEIDTVDHIRAHCLTRVEPISWGFDIDETNPAIHPKAVECSRVAMEGFGLRNAIVFPIHVPACGLGGGVSFGADIDRPAFDKRLTEIQPTLHLAALMAHTKIQTLLRQDAAAAYNLSERERDCLLWLAQGLRTARIADRLGIKEVTVNFYIGKAKRKLQARTREQAVAKAVMLGLIEP